MTRKEFNCCCGTALGQGPYLPLDEALTFEASGVCIMLPITFTNLIENYQHLGHESLTLELLEFFLPHKEIWLHSQPERSPKHRCDSSTVKKSVLKRAQAGSNF